MNKQSIIAQQKRNLVRYPELLFVAYATVDLISTFIRVNKHYDEVLNFPYPESVSPPSMPAPLVFYINPILLLLACIGLWVRKPQGYLVTIATSFWLIYRIVWWWAVSAKVDGQPMLSWLVSGTWWFDAPISRWDIPRMIICAVMFIYAVVALIRKLRHKDSKILITR
jgi:hypothetical protein